MVHRYVRDNGHELIIYVHFIVKYVCYIGLESNGCIVIGATLMDDYYRMNIISGVYFPRPDSVVWLVLCAIAYNVNP
jgi:hypothetical protein